ncbi:MAG: hypothetical protein M1444_03720 [Patescibacteria group bacterium]|nr:hypothetical protein [Patescibacteria group bacterium]
MKKILPVLFLILASYFLIQFAPKAFAVTDPFPTLNPVSSQAPLAATTIDPTASPPSDGTWVSDSDVTFVGKVGARAGAFLDWTLQNYNWSFVPSGQNPLASFWATIRNIVYAFIAIFVLITAFVLIVTRGRNVTIMRFIPKFIMIVLLITFSFALVQFIYQIADVTQGFFLKNPDAASVATHPFIWQGNLLYVGFDYQNFLGYRIYGSAYDESAFISLLLVKLTAVTYYVMVGILLLRKIILWFFIIISPIFPLLLLYSPVRNTGKIWVGEFFRWLLYAPLFSVLLAGLVFVWRSGIPLKFTFNPTASGVVYPTAINILLGGPGQTLSLVNNVNNSNSFALYIVALLMLWVVIILPFLLLRIFLSYFNSIAMGENIWMKQLVTNGQSFLGRGRNPNPEPAPPASTQPTGMARSIPFTAKIEIPAVKTQSMSSNIFSRTSSQASSQMASLHSSQSSNEILRLTNLTVPTMRDIAKYETSAMSSDITRHEEIAKVHEVLEKIANPSILTTPLEQQQYAALQDKLVAEDQKGNYLARTILEAANTVSTSSASSAKPSVSSSTSTINKQEEVAKLGNMLEKIENPDIAGPIEKQKYIAIKQRLAEAEKGGDPTATVLLAASKKGRDGATEEIKKKLKEAKERGNALASMVLMEAGIVDITKASANSFPVVNRVQSVNLDDYEAVRKMWVENYQKLEPPKTVGEKGVNRKQWISSDIDKITETINLLVSADPLKVKKGMQSVGTILPFLLIGGFSQTEVIAYLKAKLEAAKAVAADVSKKEEEENTTLDEKQKIQENPAEMSAHEEVPNDDVSSQTEKDGDSK